MSEKEPAYDYSPYEAGMTYVEKLDFRRQEHEQEMERTKLRELEESRRAKYRRSEARQETVRHVGLAIVAVLAVGMILAFITYWTMGGPPPPDGLSENERREIACVENGGGWVPEDLLTSSGKGLCIYPGKTAG